jgi:hypothetical protein
VSINIESTQHTLRWLSGIASRSGFNYIVAQKDIHGDGFAVISHQNVEFRGDYGLDQIMDKWSPEHIPWYIIPNTSPVLLTPLRDPLKPLSYDVIENVQGDKYTLIPYKDENINIGIQLPGYFADFGDEMDIQYSSIFSMMLHARPQFLEKTYLISAISDNVIYHAGVKDGKLQTGFAHDCSVTEDILYFTMLSYKEMKADPKDVPLHLINISKDNAIMSLLEKYINKIHTHDSILGSERWKSGYLAKHFFQQFHLSCVL